MRNHSAVSNLIGVGLVDLLVAITQFIGRFPTDLRTAIRVCIEPTLLNEYRPRSLVVFGVIDVSVEPWSPVGWSVIVRRIVTVVGPGDLDAVRIARGDHSVEEESRFILGFACDDTARCEEPSNR